MRSGAAAREVLGEFQVLRGVSRDNRDDRREKRFANRVGAIADGDRDFTVVEVLLDRQRQLVAIEPVVRSTGSVPDERGRRASKCSISLMTVSTSSGRACVQECQDGGWVRSALVQSLAGV